MREAQKLEIKYNAFNNMTQNESISKTYAQKRYLKWNDQEILANRAFLKKDKELEFELAQISANGPNWREMLSGGAEQVEGQALAAGSGGGLPTGEAPVPTGAPASGGGETPPAFGPPPEGGTPPAAPAAPQAADFTPETPPE